MRKLETRVLKFKYRPPVEFLLLLSDPAYNAQFPTPLSPNPVRTLVPKGIANLSPDNLKQELTVIGEPAAIGELVELQRILDVQIKELTLTLTVDSSKAIGQTKNNGPIRLSLIAQGKPYSLDVTPHVNGDQSISFFVSIPERDALAVINWGDAKGGSRIQPDGTISKTFTRVKPGEAITFKWGAAVVSLTASLLPV